MCGSHRYLTVPCARVDEFVDVASGKGMSSFILLDCLARQISKVFLANFSQNYLNLCCARISKRIL